MLFHLRKIPQPILCSEILFPKGIDVQLGRLILIDGLIEMTEMSSIM